MIELLNDQLVFSFPKIHPNAKVTIEFQRTLRIPDDGDEYSLPPGLGAFPVRHLDDYYNNVPTSWRKRGGVLLPMYQSEAMWLNFSCSQVPKHWVPYPFAIKIGTGKINATTGDEWTDGLSGTNQDYLVAPIQPWLDGYNVKQGLIRQFVAMPLGAGYSVEEQLTGAAEFGGVQIAVYPMKWDKFVQHFPEDSSAYDEESIGEPLCCCLADESGSGAMSLGAGGMMKQEIFDDPYGREDWDTEQTNRCFVHLTNSLTWRGITGEEPPLTPFTAKQYTDAGFPWFDYYDDKHEATKGSSILNKIKSVVQIGNQKGDVPLPENASVESEKVIKITSPKSKDEVREGEY